MLLALISFTVFISVYTLAYQIYLYRKRSLPWSETAEAVPAKDSVAIAPSGENVLRGLLKPFNFLGRFKAAGSLVSRSLPSKLVRAGMPLSIVEFTIFKILSITLVLVLCSIILRGNKIIFAAVGSAVGFIIPEIWLSMKIKRRHLEIRRDLPSVIDLLNLCVEASLDFMMAVERVVKDFKKCPLTDELSELRRETQMGVSRREALRNLSHRVGLTELSSFVQTLLQADRMGSPMNEALKIQSEEIRMRYFLQGEEAALKAPIKLLFPLIFFILPAVGAIVAGPIILQFMQGGIKF